MTADKPLEDIRVLDFSQFLAGPYASHLLSSLGAEVVKVERPQFGDSYRQAGPPFIGDVSVPFYAVNQGKASVALNLAHPDGREPLKRLVETADVVIVGGKPTALARIGLDYDTVSAFRGDIVYCSISGYGLEGPKSHLGALDLVIQAASGLMAITGNTDDIGSRVGVPITDYGTGMYAALAIVSALRHRDSTGEGAEIDANLLSTAVSWGAIPLLHYQVTGENQPRTGNVHPHIAPYQVIATSDGHVALSAPSDAAWSRLAQAIGAPELAEDPRYETNPDRLANITDLVADLELRFKTRTTEHWVESLTEAGIPSGPLQGHDALIAKGEWRIQSGLVASDVGRDDNLLVPGRPFKLNRLPGPRPGPTPAVGEHTEQRLKTVGFKDHEIAELRRAGVIE